MKENKIKNTSVSFILQTIKPYKWWYILMLQAVIMEAFYPIIYNYSLKLLIDLFTKVERITYSLAFWPVFLFIFANALLGICWRVHNVAAWRSMPHIPQDIFDKVFSYISGHS